MATMISGRTGGLIAGLGLALTLAACGGGKTYTLNGSVVLRSPDSIAIDGSGTICAGAVGSGYEDILGGETVAVANGEGKILKETTLGPGQPSGNGSECTFPWQVTELPESEDYFVVVGERPPVPYSLDEFRQDDFEIVLALNDPAA